MATERSYSGTAARMLAIIATLTQPLLSNCQSEHTASKVAASIPAANSSSSAASTAPSHGGAAGLSGEAPASKSTSVTTTHPTQNGVAGTAAMSGMKAQAGGDAARGAAGATQSGASTSPPSESAGTSSSAPSGINSAAAATLPAVDDFKATGPFTPKSEPGPSGYVLFYPQDLSKDGVKHPILSWGPGAAETAADFTMLLNHLASHGFAVISFDGTPQGQELVTGIDWMLEQNMKEGSTFFQKLDPIKISAGGHSAGSLATFVIGGDQRLVTTLHISGGTFDPHTDIKNLHAPALFVCGEPGGDGLLQGDVASPNCEIDFNNAMVPVFYGVTKGAAHMTPTDIGDPAIRKQQFGAIVGWLRWQLAADSSAKQLFVGDGCGLCMDAAWSTAKPKNLN